MVGVRRICDLQLKDIKVGMRVRSLANPMRIGVITIVDPTDDNYAWIRWAGDDKPYSGFYGTDCECEVVEEEITDA